MILGQLSLKCRMLVKMDCLLSDKINLLAKDLYLLTLFVTLSIICKRAST